MKAVPVTGTVFHCAEKCLSSKKKEALSLRLLPFIFCHSLSVESKCVNGLHGGRLLCWVQAEDDTHRHGEEYRYADDVHGQAEVDVTYHVDDLHGNPRKADAYKAAHKA